MDVRFLRDFRGKLTGEIYYPEGATVSLPNGEAMALVEMGVCEVAQESSEGGEDAVSASLDPHVQRAPEVTAAKPPKPKRAKR